MRFSFIIKDLPVHYINLQQTSPNKHKGGTACKEAILSIQ